VAASAGDAVGAQKPLLIQVNLPKPISLESGASHAILTGAAVKWHLHCNRWRAGGLRVTARNSAMRAVA
jgi:hypothetical protein